MQNIRCGGLNGKARQVRHRSRAARMFAQQLLEEYLEPVDVVRPERFIPIRARSEFLPTVAAFSTDRMLAADLQLDLPLTSSTGPDCPAESETQLPQGSESLPAQGASPAVEPATSVPAETVSAGDETAAVATKEKVKIEFVPVPPRPIASARPVCTPAQPEPPFSVRRFVYGCVLGGAAAAAILLLVHVAFG